MTGLQGKPGMPGLPGRKGEGGMTGRDGVPGRKGEVENQDQRLVELRAILGCLDLLALQDRRVKWVNKEFRAHQVLKVKQEKPR